MTENRDGSYSLRIYLGEDADGKRRYRAETFRGTKRQAEARLTELLSQSDSKSLVARSKRTVNELVTQWIETIIAPTKEPRTVHGYRALAQRYLQDGIGRRRVQDIDPLDIQQLYARMVAQGLSPTTVRHLHFVLKPAFTCAVKWQWRTTNPCDDVDLPKQKHTRRVTLKAEDVPRFIEACAFHRFGLIFEVMLFSGLRPGEALALKWADVDFERNGVTVNQTLVRIGEGWQLRAPKTAKSVRFIPLPLPTMARMRQHRRDQSEQRLRVMDGWQNHGFVFCSEIGTPLTIPNITNRGFRIILKELRLPLMRLYDLRHTTATILLQENVHPKVVGERLGHSTIRLTMDTYSHVIEGMQDEATTRLAKIGYRQEAR